MKIRFPLAACMLAALAACGGGGGGDDAPPPVARSLQLNGVAARGAALAGATVSARCATGSGSAVTNASGRYTLALEDGVLPCVLRATSGDNATTLHSVAAGSASATTATANVTPLTELVTAQVGAQAPANFFDGFNATSAAAVTPAAVTQASTTAIAVAEAANVDLGGVTDPIGGALVPAGGGGSGDAYGAALAALDSNLAAANTPLETVTTIVADAAANGAPPADVAATAAATVQTTVQPAAAACAGLKTGAYRVIDPTRYASTFNVVQVDATALTWTDASGTHALTANADCDFTLGAAEPARLLVSAGGVITMSVGTAPATHIALALPDQTLPASVLGGDWNIIGLQFTDDSPSALKPMHGKMQMTSAGAFASADICEDAGSCQLLTTDLPVFLANEAGGFSYTEPNEWSMRLVAYRGANGGRLLVMVSQDGEFYLLRPKSALSVPELGSVSSFWNLNAGATLGTSAVSADSNTVTAAGAGTFELQFASDSHFDTRSLNQPFDGLRLREAGGCRAADGGAYTCNPIVQMPTNLGLSFAVSASAARSFLTFSVGKP